MTPAFQYISIWLRMCCISFGVYLSSVLFQFSPAMEASIRELLDSPCCRNTFSVITRVNKYLNHIVKGPKGYP